MGSIIPAGTGYPAFRNIRVREELELPEFKEKAAGEER